MRIVILGANGFIGRNLVHDLRESTCEVVALSQNIDQKFFRNYPSVETHEIDFNEINLIRPHLREGDVVIHLVYQGIPYLADQNRAKDILHNLIPTVKLTELALEKEIKRLVFISSGGAVYGNTTSDLIDEDTPTEPVNSYGITRLASEKYIKSILKNTPTDYAILRISNPFGRFSKPNSSIGIFNRIRECLRKGEPFELRAPLETTRDYIDVEEISKTILNVAESTEQINDTFNVSSGNGMSIQEVIDFLEKETQKKLIVTTNLDNSPLVCANVLNNEKIRRSQILKE